MHKNFENASGYFLFFYFFRAPLPLSSPRGVIFLIFSAIFLAGPWGVYMNPRHSFRQHCCRCCCCRCCWRCCFYWFTLKTIPSAWNCAPPRYSCRQTYDTICTAVIASWMLSRRCLAPTSLVPAREVRGKVCVFVRWKPRAEKRDQHPGEFSPRGVFVCFVERSPPDVWERPGVFFSTQNFHVPWRAFSKDITVIDSRFYDVHLSGQIVCIPDLEWSSSCCQRWEPRNLHDLRGRVSWVGSVLFRYPAQHLVTAG